MRILPTRCHFNGKCVCAAYKFTKLFSGSIRDNAKPDIVIFLWRVKLNTFKTRPCQTQKSPAVHSAGWLFTIPA